MPRRLSTLMLSFGVVLFAAVAFGEPQIPEKLLGVWTPDGTTLKGGVVTSGEAIYLDVDGVGALVARNGDTKSFSRIVVSEFSENNGHLEVDVTEGGQVVRHLTLTYDAQHNVLASPDDPSAVFRRRRLEFSPDVRAALGLETRPLSIPSVLVPRAPAASNAQSTPQ